MLKWHRILLSLAVVLLGGAAAAGTGKVSMQSTSIGVGVGFRWGSGTLEYEGREIPFRLSGYKVLDLGIIHISPTGSVSNLDDVDDFEGKYSVLEGSWVLGAGGTGLRMRNEDGVVLNLSGLALGLGGGALAGAINIELGKIPEPPEVSAPPPEPEVAAAPPVPEPAPDPCEDPVTLGGVNFDFDRATLRPEAGDVLGPVGERLKECPEEQIRVDGFTDSVGPVAHNESLSERRAAAVREYLVGQGVNGERISAQGFGPADPVASNATPEGRAENRRAVIHPLD